VSLTAPKFLIQFFDEVGGSISNHDCFWYFIMKCVSIWKSYIIQWPRFSKWPRHMLIKLCMGYKTTQSAW
jgi:hypothetical protein